jgi:phage/plasmid-associated DNA primase
VDETDGDLVLDAGALKMLVSSKFMPATELYRGKQRKLPRDWTIVANANLGQMPVIRRLDTGLERRIRVVPVPESDPLRTPLADQYADVIVAEEGAAVASLLVMMAAHVLAHGLPEPPTVITATEEYFERCDPRRAWLRERIAPAPGGVISSSEAYETFKRETGSLWVTQTDFSLFVQARGYEIRKDGRGYMMIVNARWLDQPCGGWPGGDAGMART